MRTKLLLAALLAALCLLSVGVSGCVSPTPATSTTQFTSGTVPPQAVIVLIRHGGTAALLFNQPNCPSCDEENLKFIDFMTQYPHVSYAMFNLFDNTSQLARATSQIVAHAYNVTSTPTIVVVRKDGAFATFIGPPNSTGLIDLNTVKSAIDDAQKWRSDNPQATVAAPTDYSSYFNTAWTGGNAIMVQPFTRGTNERGNDVYKGIARNSSLPASAAMTTVIELTPVKALAKQLYDQTVAQKINEGFTLRPDWVASAKAQFPYLTEVWEGQQSVTGQAFIVEYYNNSDVSPSWLFVTEAGGAGS